MTDTPYHRAMVITDQKLAAAISAHLTLQHTTFEMHDAGAAHFHVHPRDYGALHNAVTSAKKSIDETQ